MFRSWSRPTSAGGPNANHKKQDEDRAGSQRDWLQKAQEKLTECHRSIIEAGACGGHITPSVDLTCA